MGKRLAICSTSLRDLKVIESASDSDERGSFARLFCADELSHLLGHNQIKQINHSCTRGRGTVRGLHYQRAPYCEVKFVRCIKGKIWDVVVDLRKNSTTFLKWFAEELSQDNARMMMIPNGFAHGFQVLEPNSELIYIHTEYYKPEAEGGLMFDDPCLAIKWPLKAINLSERDKSHLLIDKDFNGITL